MKLPRLLRLPSARSHAFLQRLPLRARVLFFAAILFTFGSVGFIQDSMNVTHMAPWAYVGATAAYAGLVAVGYALAISARRVLLPLAVAFHLLVPRFVLPALQRALGMPEASPLVPGPLAPVPAGETTLAVVQRLQTDGILTMACIVLGYFFFIRLISGEGRRRLRLETEIALAERLHATLVPPVERRTERFEVFGRSEPSSEVGGDLLDIVERDQGLVLCVADVAGHGVSAGAFMGMVKSAIRMKLLASDALDSLLDDLNEVVGQIRRPEMFVTFAGLRFDATNSAEVALAGHLPILRCRSAGGAIESIDNAHPPLGVVGHQRHTSTRVPFEPGDLFVVLTDGLTEVANAAGQQLGTSGICRAVAGAAGQPLGEIYASILRVARTHGPQTDDQTLLLVRIR